jgi:hypothetical protein
MTHVSGARWRTETLTVDGETTMGTQGPPRVRKPGPRINAPRQRAPTMPQAPSNCRCSFPPLSAHSKSNHAQLSNCFQTSNLALQYRLAGRSPPGSCGTSPLGPGALWRSETVPGGGGTTMGIMGTPWLCRPGPRVNLLRQRPPNKSAGPKKIS